MHAQENVHFYSLHFRSELAADILVERIGRDLQKNINAFSSIVCALIVVFFSRILSAMCSCVRNNGQSIEHCLEFLAIFELVVHPEASNTEVHYLTPCAAKILGCEQNNKGFDILDCIAQRDRKRVLTTLQNCTADQQWLQEFTTIAGNRVRVRAKGRLHKKGGIVWTGVLDDVGVEHDLAYVSRERDRHKAAANQLARRCSFLAHEVRNTLFPHQMMLAEIKDHHPGSVENVELMQAGYRTVGKILDRALMVAKHEAGEMPTKSVRFDLVQLCKSLVGYASAATARNSNQQVDIVDDVADSNSSLWVVGDRQVCEQAATNLLSNAIKYGDGKQLKLHLSYDGSVFTFTVTDKGKGMSAEDLETARAPFGTIREGDDETQGTGLGLPLSHAMLVNAGGSLALESKGVGHGTTATMQLPLPQSICPNPNMVSQSDELPAWVNDCKSSAHAVRVLLVDDSKLILKMMSRLCAKVGIDCDTATNGEAALDLMTQQHKQYTLVLIDRCMPGLHGDVVCQKARESGYKGVVVLLTGDQIADPAPLMHEFGLSGVLCKSKKGASMQSILEHIAV